MLADKENLQQLRAEELPLDTGSNGARDDGGSEIRHVGIRSAIPTVVGGEASVDGIRKRQAGCRFGTIRNVANIEGCGIAHAAHDIRRCGRKQADEQDG
jgi:hypothetical protein